MDQDKKDNAESSKGAEPSFSQIQKAAELLKIRRFAQTGAPSAAPESGAASAAPVAAEAPKAPEPAAAEKPKAEAPAAALSAAAPVASPSSVPAPASAPVAAPSSSAGAAAPKSAASVAAPSAVAPAAGSSSAAPVATGSPASAPIAAAPAPAATADKSVSHGPSIAEPVSLVQPGSARATATPAAPAAKQPAPAGVVAMRTSGGTVPDPKAQAAAANAEASLPAEYAELKRQALAKAQAQMPQESRLALPVGTQLQEYTIEWTLGIGGFGITYLAMDNNLEAEVAIKEYFPSDMCARDSNGGVRIKTAEDEEAFKEGLDKFLKECRTLANFKHGNVVRVSRFFQANNTAYMVMDYESGDSFKDWLGDRKTIDEALLLKMILPLLDGLDVVHKAGFLHRDIKPANIFVRKDDSMVLLDFGAARHAVGTRSRSLTTIVTPGYAPFEQYHSHGKQGPWTDLYAFGGMLYWVITGAKPVEAPARIKADKMVPASKAGADRFSPSFLAAVDWALVPDENKRPQSVAEFKAALTSPTPVTVPTQAAAPAANPQPLPTTTIKPQQPKAPVTPGSGDKTGDAKKWWKPWGVK